MMKKGRRGVKWRREIEVQVDLKTENNEIEWEEKESECVFYFKITEIDITLTCSR